MVNFLVSESELGSGASSLEKGVKAISIRVADLKQSTTVAIDSTEKLPRYLPPHPAVEAGLKPLRDQERAALDAYTAASDSIKKLGASSVTSSDFPKSDSDYRCKHRTSVSGSEVETE